MSPSVPGRSYGRTVSFQHLDAGCDEVAEGGEEVEQVEEREGAEGLEPNKGEGVSPSLDCYGVELLSTVRRAPRG